MIERADPKSDTKTRILEAAERLFGMNGFDAVSLREITAEAKVNLAAVNYHFQSKEALVNAAIARRIEPLNTRRLALLDAAGPNPNVEQILDAFLRPIFEIDPKPLGPLIGRVLSNPEMFVDRIFNVHLAPLAKRFLEAFARALPDVPLQEVAWRQHFMIGIMTHTLVWGEIISRISSGLCDSSDRNALLQRTIQFLAAGFRAPATQL
jgi:AcrR family transcriptional regulator